MCPVRIGGGARSASNDVVMALLIVARVGMTGGNRVSERWQIGEGVHRKGQEGWRERQGGREGQNVQPQVQTAHRNQIRCCFAG